MDWIGRQDAVGKVIQLVAEPVRIRQSPFDPHLVPCLILPVRVEPIPVLVPDCDGNPLQGFYAGEIGPEAGQGSSDAEVQFLGLSLPGSRPDLLLAVLKVFPPGIPE